MNPQLDLIAKEIATYHSRISDEQMNAAADLIAGANRLFVAGAGRSGFAARAFANRLGHLGKPTWFVGEPTTPPIAAGDLLIIGSGSGTTASLLTMAKKAKALDAKVVTFTMFPAQAIGSLADVAVAIPGSTPKRDATDVETAHSAQPMGSMFEQLCWLTYDALIMMLMPRLNQTADEMFSRHANLE